MGYFLYPAHLGNNLLQFCTLMCCDHCRQIIINLTEEKGKTWMILSISRKRRLLMQHKAMQGTNEDISRAWWARWWWWGQSFHPQQLENNEMWDQHHADVYFSDEAWIILMIHINFPVLLVRICALNPVCKLLLAIKSAKVSWELSFVREIFNLVVC